MRAQENGPGEVVVSTSRDMGWVPGTPDDGGKDGAEWFGWKTIGIDDIQGQLVDNAAGRGYLPR
jgi:hypothetical protein